MSAAEMSAATAKGSAMYPSSTLCRTQEQFHRERAASTTLENVRLIATSAAAAWGLEAAAAEKREARGVKTRALADLLAAQKLEAAEARERGLSENPDRGFEAD
jgi:hypothetical protein